MKICLLTHTFPRYKADTVAAFMHPFVLSLKKKGNEVVVLTPFNVNLRPSEFPYRIITYKYFWPDRLHLLGYSQTLKGGTNFKSYTFILAPFLFLFGFLALLKLLKKERFDIISAHWILPNGFIAFLASKITGVAYTISLPGSDVYVANKNPIFAFLARTAAYDSSAIVADSPIYLKELSKTGIKINKSHVIPYPVDISKLKTGNLAKIKLRKKLGIEKDTSIILTVGRLIHKKGFNYLLEALLQILKKQRRIILLIVGDGDLRTNWERLARKLEIENIVKFVGNVEREEIPSYYSLADIFVMPSIKDKEGNIDDRPVALLEAIATGLPVVATNFSGNALSVKNGINGFLVPQKNPNAIANSILKIITSKNLMDIMGKKSRVLAKEQFSLDVVGTKYIVLFKEIINKT